MLRLCNTYVACENAVLWFDLCSCTCASVDSDSWVLCCCRPTTVHQFLVRGTIEERMHHLLQTVNMPLQCHDAEQTTLTIGDLSKLFEHMSSDTPELNSADIHWISSFTVHGVFM